VKQTSAAPCSLVEVCPQLGHAGDGFAWVLREYPSELSELGDAHLRKLTFSGLVEPPLQKAIHVVVVVLSRIHFGVHNTVRVVQCNAIAFCRQPNMSVVIHSPPWDQARLFLLIDFQGVQLRKPFSLVLNATFRAHITSEDRFISSRRTNTIPNRRLTLS
jgi:hypothetical protein